MASLLSSPRRRRRLGWTLGIGGTLAAIVVVSVLYGKSGGPADTPVVTDAGSAAPVVPTIRVTPAVRREVDRTVQTFVHTAVVRRNLASAWPLASPSMRQSITRADWVRGDIPVQPFPAAELRSADWRLRYRSERTLGIDVMLQPRRGSDAAVMVYAAEVSAPGTGPPRRFLVDSWVPQATLGGGGGSAEAAGTETTGGGGETTAAGADAYDRGTLGAEWFLVPAAIVLLLLATLGGFGVRSVLRARRAERAYREQFGRR